MDRKEQMQMFQQILGTYFEKVKQSIPPQYKAFKDFVVKMGGENRPMKTSFARRASRNWAAI